MKKISVVVCLLVASNLLGQVGMWRFSNLPRVEPAELHQIGKLEVTLSHLHLWSGSVDVETDAYSASDRALSGYLNFGAGLAATPELFLYVGSSYQGDIYTKEEVTGRTDTQKEGSDGFGDLIAGFDLTFPGFEGFRFGLSPYVTLPLAGDPEDVNNPVTDTVDFWGAKHDGGLFRRFSLYNYGLGLSFLGTYSFPQGTRIHLNLGFANCVDRYHPWIDQEFGGIAVEHQAGIFTPFIELFTYNFFESSDDGLNPLDDGYGPTILSFGCKIGTNRGLSFGLAAGIPVHFTAEYDRPAAPPASYSIFPDHQPDFTLDMYLSLALARTPKVEPTIEEGNLIVNVKEEDGSPIPDLVVEVSDSIFHSTMTNQGGRATFADLPAGVKKVTISLDGYEPFERIVTVKYQETTTLNATLVKLTSALRVNVSDASTGEPIPATVTFAGESYETDGVFSTTAAPGTYTLVVSAEGYIEQIRKVELEAREDRSLDIILVMSGMQIVLEGINFEFNSSTIRVESYPILDHAAEILKDNPDIRVEVQGHTDSKGSESYNQKLSQARAESVKEYLEDKQGIDPSRLIAKGYGELKPIATNETEEGRAKNRRVEFKIM
jgi:outer membrane protein OmpA-like peptidoglycan-associated protein